MTALLTSSEVVRLAEDAKNTEKYTPLETQFRSESDDKTQLAKKLVARERT